MKSISISKLIHFFFLIAILLPVTFAYAGNIVTIEGTLKGAGCVHFKQECSDDDAHIAMEKDFVLVLPDGQHYFLPNLSSTTKARYAGREIRISGELDEHSIWVDQLEIKADEKYKTVWSRKQQQELYKEDGG